MTCRGCPHFRQPGKSDGYCAGRPELPPAYGPNHPLRRIPDEIRSGKAACPIRNNEEEKS